MARAISEAQESMRAAEASQAPLLQEREALLQERSAMWVQAQRAEADAEVRESRRPPAAGPQQPCCCAPAVL